MNLQIRVLRALFSRWRLIAAVTIAVGVLAVLKELVAPSAYVSEKLLVVTQMNANSEAAGLVPEPFNPRAYEQLVRSTAVCGEVLENLTRQGWFEDDDPPELEDFMRDLAVQIEVLDETARPVNYSPIIRLTAAAEKEDLAVATADAWAAAAIKIANEAVVMRVASSLEGFRTQKEATREDLEEIWDAIEAEQAIWDLTVLRQEMDTRVSLINDLEQKRASTNRDLATAQERLRMLKGELVQAVGADKTEYRNELETLYAQYAEEAGQWNLEVLRAQIDQRVSALAELTSRQIDVARDLAAAQKRLDMLKNDITLAVEEERATEEAGMDALYAEFAQEVGQNNLTVLKAQVDERIQTLNRLFEQQNEVRRELVTDQKRLDLLQTDVQESLALDLEDYETELASGYEQLAAERSQANLDVLNQQLNYQLNLMHELLGKDESLQRKIAAEEQRLARVEESINAERPFIELAKAPSDDAYWITTREGDGPNGVGDGGGASVALEPSQGAQPVSASGRKGNAGNVLDVLNRVMVTQQPNTVYWTLRQAQQEAMALLASANAERDIISTQLEQALEMQQRLAKEVARHDALQEQMVLDLGAARERYLAMDTETLRLRNDQRDAELQIAVREQDLQTLLEQAEQVRAEREALETKLAQHDAEQEILALDIAHARDRFSSLDREHHALGEQQREVRVGIAANEATRDLLNEQLTTINSDIDQLESQLASHDVTQKKLDLDITTARQRYLTLDDEQLGMRKTQRDVQLEIAVYQNTLNAVETQIQQYREEQEALEAQIAERRQVQNRLETQEQIAKDIYTDLAKAESFVTAAHALAAGGGGDETSVGLNMLSRKTYAMEHKGMLGRKGRVLVAVFFAFCAAVAWVLLRDVALPMAVESGAVDAIRKRGNG